MAHGDVYGREEVNEGGVREGDDRKENSGYDVLEKIVDISIEVVNFSPGSLYAGLDPL